MIELLERVITDGQHPGRLQRTSRTLLALPRQSMCEGWVPGTRGFPSCTMDDEGYILCKDCPLYGTILRNSSANAMCLSDGLLRELPLCQVLAWNYCTVFCSEERPGIYSAIGGISQYQCQGRWILKASFLCVIWNKNICFTFQSKLVVEVLTLLADTPT